jgi:hypothetical protein
MSERFLTRASVLWTAIYQIVKENCEVPFRPGDEEDMMTKLLKGKG